MNELGKAGKEFLFIIDFEFKHAVVLKKEDIDPCKIMFSFGNNKNYEDKKSDTTTEFRKYPVSRNVYAKAFKTVMDEIQAGNTYLINLTFQTKIETDCNLEEIFRKSRSDFKLYWKDAFVVFSPELFVRISDGTISSYPMKGTIDADIPDAKQSLLNNAKEIAEHYTIVDLIRNDLNMVAEGVNVTKLRYIDKIRTNQKDLLQLSSEITGKLPHDYRSHLGDLFSKLLPAGSVSGAPKQKTIEIIHKSENYERGFYTGVAGYFDGHNVESYVLIRFIEKIGEEFYYKSGGGITFQSIEEEEYTEMNNKIYIPI
jgi:para-aminobenzoate synthetase component 1